MCVIKHMSSLLTLCSDLELTLKMTVFTTPSGITLYEGAHVTLTCIGTLSVNVTGVTVNGSWTGPDEQQIITTSDTLNVSQTVMTGDREYQSTVVIFPSSVNDSGLYTCKMNAHTEDVIKQFMGNESIILEIKG